MSLAVRIAFFTLLSLALALAIHAYLYRRFVRALAPPAGVRRAVKAAAALLLLLALGGRSVGARSEGVISRAVIVAALMWLGFVINLFVISGGLDAARALWRRRRAKAPELTPADAGRRAFLSQAAAAGTALAAGGLTAIGAWRTFHAPEVSEHVIALPFLPRALDGLTVVQLSDVHVGAVMQRKFMDELTWRVNQLEPDLVAITGDLVDGSVAHLGRHVAALQNLSSRFGTFFITGNHDYYSGDEEWSQALAGLGVSVLRNRRVEIGDAASLDLVGVDDWSARKTGRGYDLARALAGARPGRASILLAHQPTNLEQVSARGIGLQLSGHTHGGQFFPVTLGAQAIYGARAAGLSRAGETWVYVSRGCGFVGPPLRAGSAPEIVKIVLTAS